jgi:hypothetical protein
MANAFGRFAMSTPVPLRSDFDAAQLHKLARGSRDPDQTRRLLALAEVYAGGSRSDAARIGGVGLQIVCVRVGIPHCPFFHCLCFGGCL